MMKKFILQSALLAAFVLLHSHFAFSQNGVAIAASTSTADVSAMLDIQSTSKGALVPRMTNAQRAAIATPANGLLVFCTDAPSGFYYNSGTSSSPVWVILSAGALTGTGTTNYAAKWTSTNTLGNGLIYDNGTGVGIGTTTTLSNAFTVNNAGTTAGTSTSYPIAIARAGTVDYTIGSDASNIYEQSWNSKPLVINGQGNNVGIGTTPSYKLDVAGDINTNTGFTISGAATSGNYLRGNGSNFVSSTIQASDIPAGNGNYIQNTTTQQASSNFNISGTGIIGGNLGMAVASPGYKITFNTDGSGLGWSNSGYSRIFDNGDLHIQTDDNMWFDGITGTNILYLSTSGTYAGRVGIGTSSPANTLDVRGNMDVSGLAGTGSRFVYADASGNLSAGNNSPNVAYVVDRTQRTNGAKIQASISNATNNLAVVTGDIVIISATFKFAWNGGSGTDQPIFGINVTGCATTTLTDSYQVGDADDIARSQLQVMSFQYVYTATCTGNLQFAIYADTKTNADDGCLTADAVVIARKY